MLSTSESKTIEIGKELSSHLTSKTIVFMLGDLGAGKTTFVKGVVNGLNGNINDVSSPTYIYVHEYDLSKNKTLIHIDLYRTIKGGFDNEIYAILEESNSPLIIEWPDNIGDDLIKYIIRTRTVIKVNIKITKSDNREIIIDKNV